MFSKTLHLKEDKYNMSDVGFSHSKFSKPFLTLKNEIQSRSIIYNTTKQANL